jgi:hypothetical protein
MKSVKTGRVLDEVTGAETCHWVPRIDERGIRIEEGDLGQLVGAGSE